MCDAPRLVPPGLPAPLTLLCTPARPVKMVCEKMKEPVMPQPTTPVARFDRPGGGRQGGRGHGVGGQRVERRWFRRRKLPLELESITARPAARIPRAPTRTDGGQLPVEVEAEWGVLLDGRNVHAAAEADEQKEAHHLRARCGQRARVGWGWGGELQMRRRAVVQLLAACWRSPCPLAAGPPRGSGSAGCLRACRTFATGARARRC